MSLSRGGADASVVREFDLTTKSFVKDGYTLAGGQESDLLARTRQRVCRDRLWPGLADQVGLSANRQGMETRYAAGRGEVVFEAKPDDMSAAAFRDLTPGFERDIVVRRPTFWTTEIFLRRDGKLVKIDKPDDARASFHREWLLLQLRSDWTVGGNTYPAGALDRDRSRGVPERGASL